MSTVWAPPISRKKWLKLANFLARPDVPESRIATWFVEFIDTLEAIHDEE